MIESTDPREHAVGTAIRILLVLGAITYLVAATLHMGVQIPLGFAVLSEPPILPATIVEGLSGLVLAIAAYGVLTERGWAWPAAVSAHLFSIAGVMLGIIATTLGPGPGTELNGAYHGVILLMLLVGITLLLSAPGRAALSGRDRS